MVLRTRFCELVGVQHPVVLGGMGYGTSTELVAAVSAAGGLGILGASLLRPEDIPGVVADLRRRTEAPFGLNLLLFRASQGLLEAVIEARPPVFSTVWPDATQDLRPIFERAHAAGCLVMHMVSTAAEALGAAQAGADVLVAQGTEGGGHVGLMGSSVLVPMVAERVSVPVLAAGGFATGAGLAAALALGADGLLLGTRFLATPESPIHPGFKQAILDSDGHDTLLTELTDVALGWVWPGAYARVRRNRLVETWLGREGELRRQRGVVAAGMAQARRAGNADDAVIYTGQTAGLIDTLVPAAEVVRMLVADAERIIAERLSPLVGAGAPILEGHA